MARPDLSPEEKIARMRGAQEVLGHATFQEVTTKRLRVIADEWINPPDGQTEADREKLHLGAQEIKALVALLTRWVREGESAAKMMAAEAAKNAETSERKRG